MLPVSAEMGIIAAGPIGKNRRVQHFPATGAFPGIKGTDKIIELLSKHSTFAAWTLHGNPPDNR
jgi:hypothetical protein